jgi:threonine synthase
MNYVSTRGTAPALGFGDVLLAGLARDGGLYVPESWPPFAADRLAAYASMPYAEVAAEVMWPFVSGTFDRDEFRTIVADAYATFDDPDVVPLRDLGDGLWLMELFHGPTLAFKDIALQLVGRLFDHQLAAHNTRVTIVGATSGDTGSAAIDACRDRDAIDIFIMHPAGRVSEVQRRQMTTVDAERPQHRGRGHLRRLPGPREGAVQRHRARDRRRLSAVNSINWARVMAQIVTTSWVSPGSATAAPARSASASRRATSATCSPATARSAWAPRSISSSSARTATTSSPGSCRPAS